MKRSRSAQPGNAAGAVSAVLSILEPLRGVKHARLMLGLTSVTRSLQLECCELACVLVFSDARSAAALLPQLATARDVPCLTLSGVDASCTLGAALGLSRTAVALAVRTAPRVATGDAAQVPVDAAVSSAHEAALDELVMYVRNVSFPSETPAVQTTPTNDASVADPEAEEWLDG